MKLHESFEFYVFLEKDFYELKSNGDVVTFGDGKEFSIILTQEINGERISTNGTARYNLKNLLNMELNVKIPKMLSYDIILKKNNDEFLSSYKFKLSSAHKTIARKIGFLVASSDLSFDRKNITVSTFWKYNNFENNSTQFLIDFHTQNILKKTGTIEDSENFLEFQNSKVLTRIKPIIKRRKSDFSVRVQTVSQTPQDSSLFTTDFNFDNQLSKTNERINTNYTTTISNNFKNYTFGVNYTSDLSTHTDFSSSFGKFYTYKITYKLSLSFYISI